MLYRTFKSPTSVQIELTTRCNNKCGHCYNFLCNTGAPDVTMTQEQLRQTFEELASAEVFGVTLTGGEPLLYPSLVIDGIRLCTEKGMDCSINSNLTILSEEDLLSMKEAGSFSVMTSLASFNEQMHDELMGRKGAFRLWLQSISLLKKHSVRFVVNMVVTQRNVEHVYHTGLLAYSLGARSFSATKAAPPLGCEDFSKLQPSKSQVLQSLDDLLRLKECTGIHVDALECYPRCFLGDLEKYDSFSNRKCTAGILSASISSEGDVRPCSHSDRSYGNIFETNLEQVYAKMTEWRTGELLPETCRNCPYLLQCSGGCRCEAEYTSAIDAMDPYAGCPEDVVKDKPKREPKYTLSPDSLVKISDDMECRQEVFGCILRSHTRRLVVDSEAAEVFVSMAGKIISIAEIAERSQCEVADVLTVTSAMAECGLAKPVDAKEVKA